MGLLTYIFGKKEKTNKTVITKPKVSPRITPDRIGELGEYKINLQLNQFPSNHKHIHDVLLINENSRSGYSQIDHVFLTPYAIFVIETKNYSGEIVGRKNDKQWIVNNKYKMMNPFHQNYGHLQTIKKILQLADDDLIISVISFTRRAIFRTEPGLREIKSNELCVYDTEITEYIKRKINFVRLQKSTVVYTDNKIENMFNQLKSANITEKLIREHHKIEMKSNSKTQEAKCVICGNKVSYKVKQFCMSNPKFNGKILCFEHQKNK